MLARCIDHEADLIDLAFEITSIPPFVGLVGSGRKIGMVLGVLLNFVSEIVSLLGTGAGVERVIVSYNYGHYNSK